MKTLLTAAAATALLTSTATADVQTRAIEFENEGATLQGTLYLPDGHEAGERLPTVIVTGAWTSVEEQMPASYAREMASRGFAAITFDFRGWGKSGDLPETTAGGARFIESPEAKTDDIRAAIEFASTLPEVDADLIHGLGICASAGYMVDATTGNDLVRSVGLVAPWLQDAEIVEAVYGGAEGVAGLTAVAEAAEAQVANGGESEIILAAGPEGAEGVLMPIGGYYYEPERGAIPAYDNQWNNAGWNDWLSYHPVESAEDFSKPLAIVHSDAAAIPQGVRAFVSAMAGEATERWLDGVDQFSFYDRPDVVNKAADTVAEHFRSAS